MESEGSLHIHNSKLLVPMLRQINPSPQPHTLIPILILSSRMTQYAGKIMNELTATYRNFMNISLPSSFLPLWAYKWVTIGFELVLICTWYENAMGWHTAVLQSLAHSCYYNSWHTAVLQSLAHSCITIIGTQRYYNHWHTAVLQLLAHNCITIHGTQIYYNHWHTAY